jgi:hypothetical protein
MLRGLIILLLLSAMVLTTVGWVWSYTGRYRTFGCGRLSGETKHGWWYRNWGRTAGTPLPYARGMRGVCDVVIATPCSIGRWSARFWEFRLFRSCRVAFSPINRHEAHLRVTAPFWLLFLLFAIFPAFALGKHWICLYVRRRTNHCAACGYSLEGNESGTCPECGRAV